MLCFFLYIILTKSETILYCKQIWFLFYVKVNIDFWDGQCWKEANMKKKNKETKAIVEVIITQKL